MHKYLIPCLVLLTSTSQATMRTLLPSKDNTIFETTTEPLSNGAGQFLFAGRTNQLENSARRAVLQFDLSFLPPGTTVNDVTFEVTATRTITPSSTLNLHAMLADWGEAGSDASGEEGAGTMAEPGDVTWTNAFHEGAAWSSAGGDFDPLVLASEPITGLETLNFNSVAFTALVQSWIDTPANNFGVIIIGDEFSAPSAYQLASRENSDNQPRLIIDYDLPPTSVQFTPSKDNTLYETVDGSTSNGAGDRLFMGKTNSNAIRRAVLEFDVTDIPATAVIESVALDLAIINLPTGADSGTADIHFVTAEWGAAGSSGSGNGAPSQSGDATWIHRLFDTDSWNTAGGDFIGTASASTSYSDSDTTLSFASSSGLIADVTTWVQNPAENHGWIILGDEANLGNARGMGSADNLNSNARPVLTIEYTDPDLIFADDFE
ncbi:DNRLRE domain-containing protein [Marinicella meishanensis]|uniref:DNRLRE domain-containing protein n=1 Tax=Marinicella meishanensis TaxID=2873263 RepID=UPI001CBFE192|nr:DNRLRE domain-containing protein [Marinicella sp. NBU2979]